MFDLLSFNRTNLQFQTELLEASQWSEEEADRVLLITSSVLDNVSLPDIPCPLDFFLEKTIRPALIEQNVSEIQADVIINFIQHNSKFVSWIMQQGIEV